MATNPFFCKYSLSSAKRWLFFDLGTSWNVNAMISKFSACGTRTARLLTMFYCQSFLALFHVTSRSLRSDQFDRLNASSSRNQCFANTSEKIRPNSTQPIFRYTFLLSGRLEETDLKSALLKFMVHTSVTMTIVNLVVAPHTISSRASCVSWPLVTMTFMLVVFSVPSAVQLR